MEELDLKQLVQILFRRWWIILIGILVCLFISIVYSNFVQKPLYQSSTTIYVGKKTVLSTDQGYSDIVLGNSLIKDYRELLLSRLISSKVIEDLKLTGVSPAGLAGSISVGLKNDTRVMEIGVFNNDPILAANLANKVAQVFKEQVIAIMQVENVNIIDVAEIPTAPIAPNKKFNNMIAFLVGLVLGVAINFLIEYLDTTIKSPEDVKKYLDLSVLGVIPYYDQWLKEWINLSENAMLIAKNKPKSHIAEAFRVLRTNIQFSGIDKPIRSIVFTSAMPSEGKTTVIANTAITFALQEKKVLLIDADLRRPSVHKIFKLENDKGLTNFLSVQDDYKKYVKKTSTENLDILPCGIIPPNPSELLSSNFMKSFIAKATEDYDIVLIDTPPIGTITDAALLAAVIDGTVIVASAGTVDIEAISRAKELLLQVNANIIGVVLNKMNQNKFVKYYYYYNNYYYDENSDKADRKKRKRRKVNPS